MSTFLPVFQRSHTSQCALSVLHEVPSLQPYSEILVSNPQTAVFLTQATTNRLITNEATISPSSRKAHLLLYASSMTRTNSVASDPSVPLLATSLMHTRSRERRKMIGFHDYLEECCSTSSGNHRLQNQLLQQDHGEKANRRVRKVCIGGTHLRHCFCS